MVTFAIIVSIGLVVLGIVLGLWARNSGIELSDEDVQRYVFNNAFMRQIHDYFDTEK